MPQEVAQGINRAFYPTGSQKGVNRASSLDRVVVLDTKTGDVNIRKKQKVDRDSFSYSQQKLPRGKKQIAVFIGQDREYKIATEHQARDDSDQFLAQLNLDNLGLMNRTLFHLGKLSDIYIAAPQRDIQPIHPSAGSAMHAA